MAALMSPEAFRDQDTDRYPWGNCLPFTDGLK